LERSCSEPMLSLSRTQLLEARLSAHHGEGVARHRPELSSQQRRKHLDRAWRRLGRTCAESGTQRRSTSRIREHSFDSTPLSSSDHNTVAPATCWLGCLSTLVLCPDRSRLEAAELKLSSSYQPHVVISIIRKVAVGVPAVSSSFEW
jgi:hypothetical protein